VCEKIVSEASAPLHAGPPLRSGGRSRSVRPAAEEYLPPEQAGRLLAIAVACIDHRDQKRPNMSDVLRKLEALTQGAPGRAAFLVKGAASLFHFDDDLTRSDWASFTKRFLTL
jgi:hypothetical protein